MVATTLTTAPEPPPTRRSARHHFQGHFEDHIEGRYRSIAARELALAWWCFMDGHISMRQLRIFFGAHEMVERRCYGRTQNPKEKPVYRLEELQTLVGGKGSERAARALRTDLKQLSTLGLVVMTTHSIRFAKSVDQLTVGEGGATRFAAFLGRIPNRARTVPVPRRMVRALAAGFGRAQTAYIIAALIRSVFWHRDSGRYRVDGRTMGSWVAETFQISRSAVTDARKHLIALGWLRPLEVPQWLLNKYGAHDLINVHWAPADALDNPSTESGDRAVHRSVDSPDDVADDDTTSGSPPGQDATESGRPCLNKFPFSTRRINTRRLGNSPDRSGSANRKKKVHAHRAPPTIRDVKPHDLEDTNRLMELHRQAVTVGLARGGRAGELDFLSFANRARTRGRKPGGLLVWLLRNQKADFITLADEEAAAKRLREHFNGPNTRHRDVAEHPPKRRLSPDEEVVERCILIARQHKIEDAFQVAQRVKGWTREQWNTAEISYRTTQAKQWQPATDSVD